MREHANIKAVLAKWDELENARKQVDDLARSSDDPRDPGDAALNHAEVRYLAGDRTQANKMLGQAIEHYKRKGATAYVVRAHRLAAEWALAI